MVRAAKPAPNANRMTGPKLFAAATPAKIETRNRRLERLGKHWRSVHSLDLRSDLSVEELQTLHIHSVSGGCNDVLGENLSFATIFRLNSQAHFAVLNLGALGRASEMQRHFPDHHVSDKPPSRGSKGPPDDFEAKPFGQIVESSGRIGKKARSQVQARAPIADA